jgi:predicted ribosome quality control (RQC) complex YloA/Tae2 family protein
MRGQDSQTMDIFVLKALVDDLQQRLPGALVSKVFQVSPDDLLLRLWRHEDLRLLLSTAAPDPRLYLTTHRFHTPQTPPRFAAFLRAHLRQVRLQSITVQPYDRLVTLAWERAGEPRPVFRLIHELQGSHANVVLVDAAGVIVEALKYVPAEAPYSRPVLPGLPYQPPPLPPQRLLASAVTREHLQQLRREGRWDARHLQRLIVGLGAALATELIHRSQGDPDACWELLDTLRQQYDQGTLSLWRCVTRDGTSHVTVLPLTREVIACESYASAQEAVAALYEPLLVTTHVERTRHEVQKTVRQRLQKLRRKMVNLTQDQEKLRGYLPYQHYGTLLLAQRLPRGTTSASVVDYYNPDQGTLTIPLDPRLSVRDNAQVYFKKYRKAKDGLIKVQELLTQCVTQEHELEGLAQRVAQAGDEDTLAALATAAHDRPHPSGPPPRAPGRSPAPVALPYRTFTSRDGYTFYCGKSSQGNDTLLRQVAAPEDFWLHAHQQAGAHVVVKARSQQEVPYQTLLEAAALAAFYSKGRHAVTVEVIYARAKNVRKFRGARPGQVAVQEYRTLEVAPRLPET